MSWSDFLLRYVPTQAGWIVTIASGLISLFLIREKRGSPEWWARNLLILLTFTSAVVNVASSIRSGALQNTVNTLNHLAQTQAVTIGDLRHRAAIAEGEMQRERTALDSTRAQVKTTESDIARVSRATNELSDNAQRALKESEGASARSKAIMTEVRRSTSSAQRQFDTALGIANKAVTDANRARDEAIAAAARAGVFHFATTVMAEVTGALKSAGSGNADIACAPGLESGCRDLGKAFVSAGWSTRVLLGQSFMGGGFDAQFPKENAGIVVWYLQPRRLLAEKLAAILGTSGVSTATQEAYPNPGQPPLGISFMFAARAN